MKNLDYLGPFWTTSDYFGCLRDFGPFLILWTIVDHLGRYRCLDHFGPPRTILNYFGPFWIVWTVSDRLDHLNYFEPFWTVGQFWTVWKILGHLGPKWSDKVLLSVLLSFRLSVLTSFFPSVFQPFRPSAFLSDWPPDWMNLPGLRLIWVNLQWTKIN